MVTVRRGESGQVLPWAAAGLVAAALVALLVARVAHDRYDRVRLQTAADVTALSAAASYARGLNIAAASNQVLLAASVTDLALKALGVGLLQKVAGRVAADAGILPAASVTDAVIQLQDLWAGTYARSGSSGPAGFASVIMGLTAERVGFANGLLVAPMWNDRRGPGAIMPDLNLRRATAADLAVALGGGERKVERIRVRDDEGRWVERSRVVDVAAAGGGARSRVESVATKALKLLDFPLPLVERERVHCVVVVGRPLGAAASDISRIAVAKAEVGQGEVFNAAFGNPAYDVRLVQAPAALAEDAGVLRLLASPTGLRDFLVRSAATMLADYLRANLQGRLLGRLGGS